MNLLAGRSACHNSLATCVWRDGNVAGAQFMSMFRENPHPAPSRATIQCRSGDDRMVSVETIECKRADEFLSVISLPGPPFRRLTYDFLLFRGVANGDGPAEYKLVPSALRRENFATLLRLVGWHDA